MDEDSASLVRQLREAARERHEYPRAFPVDDGHAALMFWALATTVEALGECRVTTPYASLRPILEDDGLRWACTHKNKEHRSQPVAGREP